MGRRNSITEQWAARPVEMLESPAYRVLSLSAHRVLSRIEIEFAHHGGKDNGKLPVTFDDFARYGVRRHSIGPALLELEALGFIVITEHGAMAKAAEYRRSNKFLLASRPKQKGVEVAGRWRQFKTVKEAEAAVEAARRNPPFRAAQKEKAASAETAPLPVPKRHCGQKIASAETAPQCMAETAPLSISRGGDRSQRDGARGRRSQRRRARCRPSSLSPSPARPRRRSLLIRARPKASSPDPSLAAPPCRRSLGARSR